jgi:hypothetical protein
VASVEKDKRELATIVADIADHLPKEDPNKGRMLLNMASMEKAIAWPRGIPTKVRCS